LPTHPHRPSHVVANSAYRITGVPGEAHRDLREEAAGDEMGDDDGGFRSHDLHRPRERLYAVMICPPLKFQAREDGLQIMDGILYIAFESISIQRGMCTLSHSLLKRQDD
jgi:hypothetical protein